jgi:HlyD family secretion protein
MRKLLLILLAVAVLAAAGFWVYQNVLMPAQEPQLQEREETTVERGSLVVMVNATGTILPEKQTTLSFQTPGRVAEVSIKEGQSVQAGEMLARLETRDLEFAIEQAELALASAQNQLLRIQRVPAEYDLNAAETALASVRANYNRLLAGPGPEEIQVARASLDQARHQLEGTILTAPHDGVVTAIGIKEGELTGGQPAFILTDLSKFHIEVTVDEIDIGRIVEGQPVTTTLDALPETSFSGYVDKIADTAQLDSGVVTYKVTVGLDPGNIPLRVGMTANVDIVTERRENVLLVPNRFVRVDRTTGRAYVDRLDGDQVQSIEIQIGLRDETSSEVLAGLEEGEIVVLIKESSRDQLRSLMGPPQ